MSSVLVFIILSLFISFSFLLKFPKIATIKANEREREKKRGRDIV